jgi:hypothetical protein
MAHEWHLSTAAGLNERKRPLIDKSIFTDKYMNRYFVQISMIKIHVRKKDGQQKFG